MTHHIKDPPLIEAHQPIHGITTDHTLSQPIDQIRKPQFRIHPIPEDHTEIHAIMATKSHHR